MIAALRARARGRGRRFVFSLALAEITVIADTCLDPAALLGLRGANKAMKNARLILVSIAVLGLVALALWRWQSRAEGPVSTGQNPQPPVASPVAPVLAPVNQAPAANPAQVPVVLANSATPVGYLNEAPGQVAVHAHSVADAPRVLQLVADRAGGVKGLDNLRKATYELLRTGHNFSGTVTALCDEAGNALLINPMTKTEIGIYQGNCWLKRGEVVVPCDPREAKQIQAVGLAHLATAVLPMQSNVFHAKAAGAVQLNNQLVDTVTLGGAPGLADAVLHVEPVSGRVERMASLDFTVDFGEWQTQGFARLPITRHTVLYEDDMQIKPLSQTVDRITAVQPGVDAARLKPPAVTRELAMQVGARPSLSGLHLPAGTWAGVDPALMTLVDLMNWEDSQQTEVYVVFGAPTSVESIDKDVSVWVALPPSYWSNNAAINKRVEVLATEPLVASRVVRVTEAGIAAAVLDVANRAKAAGHTLGEGRPMVHELSRVDEKTHEITVDILISLVK